MEQKYYIIETNYVGPNKNQEGYVDTDSIVISTAPATANMSHEVRIEGWCGTTNDWSVTAHGEYENIEKARAAISEIFGDVRKANHDGHEFESDDDDVVEVYRPGKYTPMSRESSANWVYESMSQDVDADTTDDEISVLAIEYEKSANSAGSTLGDIDDILIEYRQALIDELDES